MLMVIFSLLDLLTRLMGSIEPHRRYVDDIRAAALKSRDLTQQLLAFARRQILHPQTTNINDIVQSTMKLLVPTLGEDIATRTELQDGLWPIFADPSKLHQVLLNLAGNARDAMKGGGMLTIETRNFRAESTYIGQHTQLSEGDYIVLLMSDTGSGIPPDVLAKIYDPFFTTKATGTGLGLAVVKGIVEQMGAQIWCYSEIDQGTVFKIFFPRHFAITEPRPQPVDVEVLDRGTETILLIEDEQLLRVILRETLEEHGYRVLEARTAAEAIALSAEFEDEIDVVLTDVVMPGGNGRYASEELRKQRASVKIIYMSGYTDDMMIGRGVGESGIAFIEKPATTSALLRTIRAVLAEP